jgi:solute:Na+ symporter, SSS family
VAGLYTRWFHRWALLAGWAAAMVWGTIVAYRQPVPGEAGSHFGASTAVVPVLGHTAYIAVTAFVLNLVVALVLTVVFRALRLRDGTDETEPADYSVDPATGPPPPVPVTTPS